MAREQLSTSGAAHGVMRELNTSLVLELLKHESPISRAAIAKQTKLAKPTVSAIVEDLIEKQLAVEIGVGETTQEGGRPPILLEFNARSQFYGGVHVGVRRTHIVITDGRGVELARSEYDTRSGTPAAAMSRVARQLEKVAAIAGANLDAVAGIGLCVPGLVDLSTGTCLLAPNLGWRDTPLAELLQRRLPGPPVFVHNTAQACAVAEAVEGAGKGAANVVLLYAGTGVGAGLILERRLYHGQAGIAGEIGHVNVVAEAGLACSCGRRGCLETVVSGAALARRAAAEGLGAGLHVAEVAARAAQGDAAAVALLGEAGAHLGRAASWLVNLLNPDVVVVGGAFADAGPALLGPLEDAVVESSLAQAGASVAVRPWMLGQEAKVRGAVLVAMQNTEPYVRVIFRS